MVVIVRLLASSQTSSWVGGLTSLQSPEFSSYFGRKREFLETDPKKRSDITSCKKRDFQFFDENEEVIPHAMIGHVTVMRISLTINFSKTDSNVSKTIDFILIYQTTW